MDGFGLRFHHLGLAVPAPEHAFRFLEALGYRIGAHVFDPLQNVNLAMRHHAHMPDVEVIWPGDGPSPIDQMIKRGNMIYHMCFETDDADGSIGAMEADGHRVLSLGAAEARTVVRRRTGVVPSGRRRRPDRAYPWNPATTRRLIADSTIATTEASPGEASIVVTAPIITTANIT